MRVTGVILIRIICMKEACAPSGADSLSCLYALTDRCYFAMPMKPPVL